MELTMRTVPSYVFVVNLHNRLTAGWNDLVLVPCNHLAIDRRWIIDLSISFFQNSHRIAGHEFLRVLLYHLHQLFNAPTSGNLGKRVKRNNKILAEEILFSEGEEIRQDSRRNFDNLTLCFNRGKCT